LEFNSKIVFRSAIWAAQRVPDGEVSVVPNGFIIREMDLHDPTNFLASPNVHEVARQLDFFDFKSAQRFDFTQAYSAGEYTSPYYTGNRLRVVRNASMLSHNPYSFTAATHTNDAI